MESKTRYQLPPPPPIPSGSCNPVISGVNVNINIDITSAVQVLIWLVQDVVRISGTGFSGYFKKDCTDLSRRVGLLANLLEEIRDFSNRNVGSSSSSSSSSSKSCFSDLTAALQAVKRLVLSSGNFEPKISFEGALKKIAFKFQCVTWPLNSNKLSRSLSRPLDKEIDVLVSGNRLIGSLHVQNIGNIDYEVNSKVGSGQTISCLKVHSSDRMIHEAESLGVPSTSSDVCIHDINASDAGDNSTSKKHNKKPDSPIILDDFLCPISLELMRDPVIVATGQTYERSYIQRWIDCGNTTCPKTQQKLQNLTLTPNYVLRSLICQWCAKNNIQQPMVLASGRIKNVDGSFSDVSGNMATIEVLVRKLSNQSTGDCKDAVAEIRSLSKRSTDNRILIAEAGAIPVLVNLLTSDDNIIQENAVTSILNLSIYENNKELIMLAGAIPSILQVLRAGSMEARENAAATLFSLSLVDDSKIIIGASGAIPALVELLQNGSTRGKKDAATALFNLCIYQGNKGRAVRAGIITALLKMLTEPSSCMVDEALTIFSVLASHQEAKSAIVKASTIPALIDVMRTALPRNKENAAAILLSLCKRDPENLACISRLGAVIPLTELAKSGTERAKRKATSLLEHLRKSRQHQQVKY